MPGKELKSPFANGFFAGIRVRNFGFPATSPLDRAATVCDRRVIALAW
jgi:hypothetical protein